MTKINWLELTPETKEAKELIENIARFYQEIGRRVIDISHAEGIELNGENVCLQEGKRTEKLIKWMEENEFKFKDEQQVAQ